MPLSTVAAHCRNRINDRIDALFDTENGTIAPYVCVICDTFIPPKKKNCITLRDLIQLKHLLQPIEDLPVHLKQCYSLPQHASDPSLQDVVLSPRASSYVAGRTVFYRCCTDCKQTISVERKSPLHSVANNYAFGTTPECLKVLTDLELAFLSPVKSYGFCFTYIGGTHKNLKGTLSYYRVEPSSIANAAVNLQQFTFNTNIVVLLSGKKMTRSQRQKAMESSTIRIDKIMEALQWLTEHHEAFAGINLATLQQQIQQPTVINEVENIVDDSEEAGMANIEQTETYSVYFPDGQMTTLSGGNQSIEAFKSFIEQSKVDMFNVSFQCNLRKESCKELQGNNFVDANLLQFPYRIGGPHDLRLNEEGSISNYVDLEEYIKHLSRVSQPSFHRPLFVLMLYSLKQKHLMLKHANFELKKPRNVTDFVNNLVLDDLQSTAELRQAGFRGRGNRTSNKFFNAVKAITKALPHTNDAAKKARAKIEALQHHFGLPPLFLTVSFDDENSFLIQVYANTPIDDDTPVDNLPDEELATRRLARQKLRIKYPGLAALYYEYLLDIVLEEVVGYDIKTQRPTGRGLFGHCLAASVSTEEQGRRTCHGHIVMWIEEYTNVMHRLVHATTNQQQQQAIKKLRAMYDAISTTSLIGDDVRPRDAFNHDDCPVARRHRKRPLVVEPQQLRNLRHVSGYSHDKHVAFCPHCTKTWSSEQLVYDYLTKQQRVPRLSAFPDPTNRLHAKCIEYQRDFNAWYIPEPIVNAAYNHHLSFHTKTCFEKQKQNKKQKISHAGDSTLLETQKILDDIECRMRMPDLARPDGVLIDFAIEEMDWYRWDGEVTQRPVFEVYPRRAIYDVFENTSCPAISQSKCTCNSNITLLMPGPIPVYVTKYTTKDTQQEDTREFEKVLQAAKRMLSKPSSDQHDVDRIEARKRLLHATFAHNKENVIGPSLAAWLVRTDSRFHFSHKFVWCPLGDFLKILSNQGVTSQIKYALDGTNKYFENRAMHYICRPRELQRVSVFDFYTNYEVVHNTKFRRREHRNTIMDFWNHHHYRHPSTARSSNKKKQAVLPIEDEEEKPLLQVSQWEFPDVKSFHGSLFDPQVPITPLMEKYAALILVLFYPFRTNSDLLFNNSYVQKFRQVRLRLDQLAFLQNIQDSRSNSLDVPKIEDQLVRDTQNMKDVLGADNLPKPGDFDSDDEDEEENEVPVNVIDDIIESLQEGYDSSQQNNHEDSISFEAHRRKGTNKCGFTQLAEVEAYTPPPEYNYVLTQDINANYSNERPPRDSTSTPDNPPFHEIVRLLYDRTTRRQTMPVTLKENVNLMHASGSAESIMNWSCKAGIDKWQRRSFEIFTATFVLSFYKEQFETVEALQPAHRQKFLREKSRLQRLSDTNRRRDDDGQLICFLHGPGGSGKTTVIDLVLSYAREFCAHLEYPFTRKTIVVTALTGVAATLLLGETTHSAVPIGTKNLTEEHIEAWRPARLLIIDEISFASPKTLQKINAVLGKLKARFGAFTKYGGIDIIFSGDLRQLEPCREPAIYDEHFPEFHDWINCYIELHGMHRFTEDPRWGEILLRIRNGTVTLEDIDYINTRVVTSTTKLPKGLKYATPDNKERDAINTGLFYKYCAKYAETNPDTGDKYARHALLIFSDQLQIKDSNGSYVFLQHPSVFYQSCGEDDVKFGSSDSTRRDPVLMTYPGCEMMLTNNMNVPKGLANGTLGKLKQIVLKAGESMQQIKLDNGIYVNYIYASQIDYCTLFHNNNKINPREFRLAPEKKTPRVRFPLPQTLATSKKDKDFVKMTMNQMPFVRADASTGHKFQGRSVDNVFVHDWTSRHKNWTYVMLSRVKTIRGLYLRKPLPRDVGEFTPPQSYLDLVSELQQRQPLYPEDNDPYFYSWVMDG